MIRFHDCQGSALIVVMLFTMMISAIVLGCFRESVLILKMNNHRSQWAAVNYHAKYALDCLIKAASTLEANTARSILTSVESVEVGTKCGDTLSNHLTYAFENTQAVVVTKYCGAYELPDSGYVDQYVTLVRMLSSKDEVISEHESVWQRQLASAFFSSETSLCTLLDKR